MPKKGHRAASRQAQIRRNRRRTKGQGQEFDAGPTEADVTARETSASEEGLVAPVAVAASSARRSRQRASEEPVPVYGQLGAELKRIGVLTFLVVIILAVLTVFLR